jgi:nitrite reductase (NADH) small subunit
MTTVRLGPASELPGPNEVKECSGEGRTFCLVNVNGQLSAMDNECLHRGGPLGQGVVEGGKVVCPWHGWRWDPKTGQAVQDPAKKIGVYELKIENDVVMVELAGPTTQST